jgi:ASC-1-like (ASCH) protein
MKTHVLKTHPEYFQAVKEGIKTFEVRKNDRDFKVGDVLQLTEYDPETDHFSGKITHLKVTYMLSDTRFGIEPGYVVMGCVPVHYGKFN